MTSARSVRGTTSRRGRGSRTRPSGRCASRRERGTSQASWWPSTSCSRTRRRAWTPWRAALVRELVAKVQRVLDRGEVGAETAERLAEAIEAIRAELAGQDPAAVERFVLRMPRAYVLTVPPARGG